MRETTQHPSVLVADADPERRSFLRDNLTADGHRVVTASSLIHAHHKLAQGHPALLLLGPLEAPGDALALLDSAARRAPVGAGRPGAGGAVPRPGRRRARRAAGAARGRG